MPAVLLLLLALLHPAPAWSGDVGLVLVLVVDQLRPDRLTLELPGGLGRLAREGQRHPEAALDHAMSETCPGHAAVSTGLNPARNGIPSNTFLDVDEGRRVYCVDDPAPDAAVLAADGAGEGRSPRNIRGSGLGDWMKAANPSSQVFAVAGKDRAAITLGGQHPDGAYWYRRGEAPAFTTSRYYEQELPAWVTKWNGESPAEDGFLAALPDRWDHQAGLRTVREDDFVGESERFRRVSGHPLRDDDLAEFSEQLYFSPFLDELTLDFALTLAREKRLGQDDAPDLLAIGLSASDLVGHLYGPYSHESTDTLRRLDHGLGDFLDALEAQVGKGRILIALTSDHGVLPLPEWIAIRGDGRCPVETGRTGITRLGLGLTWRLHRAHSPLLSIPKEWLVLAGTQAAVNRPLAAERGTSVAAVAETARAYLESYPAIRKVWTAREIETGGDEMARLYRNAFVPGRSGDLVIQLEPDCIITLDGVGTTHGTPYLYDRAIPLLFHGPGIAPAQVPGGAASVDIAPSLAQRLGIPSPPDLDGRSLLGE